MYCSGKCASAAWRDKRYPYTTLECKRCGKEFIRLHSNAKYCSRACFGEAEKERKKRLNKGIGKGWSKGVKYVPRESCLVCRKKFYAPPVLKRRGGGKYCSRRCVASIMAQHPTKWKGSSRSKGGRRPDIGDMYFRSRWEANYARYLNWLIRQKQIVRWEFEVDTFEFPIKRGSRFYTPDFKVWNLDGSYEYHEVKGYMDQRSQTKLKRMRKYHPKETLHLIDGPVYRSIEKKVGRIIKGWESGQQAIESRKGGS